MTLRILGAGGHAKVAIEAWRSGGGEVAALYDDDPKLLGRELLGVRVTGTLGELPDSAAPLHLAIGNNQTRRLIAQRLRDEDCPPVVHASAAISPSAGVGAGVLVCAGAVVQAEAKIGRHCIVNSLALVEHDVEIGDFAHVAPGVRLGGGVRIGAGALIGIGAVLLPGIRIGDGAIVGAGAVVVRDIPGSATVAGNPARPLGG